MGNPNTKNKGISGLSVFTSVLGWGAKAITKQIAHQISNQLPAKTVTETGKKGYRMEKFDFNQDNETSKITWKYDPGCAPKRYQQGFTSRSGRFIEVIIIEK